MANSDSRVRYIERCLICFSDSLERVFKADHISLTGVFPLVDEEDPLETSITLNKCAVCGNVQMREQVDGELMFRDYWYRSSTTRTMVNHLNATIGPYASAGKRLLDIGCNDGTLMGIAMKAGMDVYGIDPSSAVGDAPAVLREKIVNDFFGSSAAEANFLSKGLRFDVITAISMFYDVAEPVEFLTAIAHLLQPGGKALIEVNYAKSFFERANVDMLGQEHLIYYFIHTFERVVRSANLFVNDAYLTDMNGGNITFILSTSNVKSKRLIDLEKAEREWLGNFEFKNFEGHTLGEFKKFKAWLLDFAKHANVKILGASTRGAFIAQLLGLDANVVTTAVDLQPNKKGRRIAGTDIAIELDGEHTEPDAYLVMPYQFKDEILRRYTSFMMNGGSLIFYRPDFCIVRYSSAGAVEQSALWATPL